MGKWLLAVCDSDENYMHKFVEFVQETKKGLFEIKSFTSSKGVWEYTEDNNVDILLISEKEEANSIKEVKVKNKIILLEGDQNLCNCEYPSINKFQSADNVIREVMEYTREIKNAPISVVDTINKSSKILGVYSPINRCYKTSLAIVLGIQLAKSKKVLYINLEEFSGFSKLLNIIEDKDLSDLIYFYKQNPENILKKFTTYTNNLNGLDFINPIVFSKDIRSIETREWTDFLKFIAVEANYEIIILDLSNMLEDVFNILEICDSIYMPILQDGISVSKLMEFEQYLQLMGMEKLLNKFVKLKLPEIKEVESGDRYFEGLLKSEFGSFVRKNVC